MPKIPDIFIKTIFLHKKLYIARKTIANDIDIAASAKPDKSILHARIKHVSLVISHKYIIIAAAGLYKLFLIFRSKLRKQRLTYLTNRLAKLSPDSLGCHMKA